MHQISDSLDQLTWNVSFEIIDVDPVHLGSIDFRVWDEKITNHMSVGSDTTIVILWKFWMRGASTY